MKNVYLIAEARRAKESIAALEPFLGCQVTPTNAKKYVEVLSKHNMLYYFEQDANDVEVFSTDENDVEYKHNFTERQATFLNVIRNRFMGDENSFRAMFDAVFYLDSDGYVDGGTVGAEQRIDEIEIVGRLQA